MNTMEFKAWFKGYAEALGGPPNAEQWEAIKAHVAAINTAAILRAEPPPSFYQPRERAVGVLVNERP